MSIRKGEAAGAAVIRCRQIIPLLWAPLRKVRMGIGLEKAVVDAVGVFIQQHKSLSKDAEYCSRSNTGDKSGIYC